MRIVAELITFLEEAPKGNHLSWQQTPKRRDFSYRKLAC